MPNELPDELSVRMVRESDGAALSALFSSEGGACFCQYWHFEGTNKEWEAQCAITPECNEQALHRDLAAKNERAFGCIAETKQGEIVGWLKLAPRKVISKLLMRVPYRALDEDGNLYSIACMMVRPDVRRKGIARALLHEAVSFARENSSVLEAYPRRISGVVYDGELHMGHEELFLELGFTLVRESLQYPVYRWGSAHMCQK